MKMSKSRQPRDYQMRAWKRSARKAREFRRKRIYLLSMQTMTVPELERTFRKIRDGEMELIGLREEPDQHPKIRGFREYIRS